MYATGAGQHVWEVPRGHGRTVRKSLDVCEGPGKEPTEAACVCLGGWRACGCVLTPAAPRPSRLWLRPAPSGLGAGACLPDGGGRAGARAELGAHTVKMLERRLDCLRTGVGVEEAATVSMRSSRWLTLGVEGTEEE